MGRVFDPRKYHRHDSRAKSVHSNERVFLYRDKRADVVLTVVLIGIGDESVDVKLPRW